MCHFMFAHAQTTPWLMFKNQVLFSASKKIEKALSDRIPLKAQERLDCHTNTAQVVWRPQSWRIYSFHFDLYGGFFWASNAAVASEAASGAAASIHSQSSASDPIAMLTKSCRDQNSAPSSICLLSPALCRNCSTCRMKEAFEASPVLFWCGSWTRKMILQPLPIWEGWFKHLLHGLIDMIGIDSSCYYCPETPLVKTCLLCWVRAGSLCRMQSFARIRPQLLRPCQQRYFSKQTCKQKQPEMQFLQVCSCRKPHLQRNKKMTFKLQESAMLFHFAQIDEKAASCINLSWMLIGLAGFRYPDRSIGMPSMTKAIINCVSNEWWHP